MTLYVYDHCPYCIKARMIFGYKGINFELKYLLNDDEKTPIEMIGQKMAPILEKEDGGFMPESLDIIDYVDQSDDSLFINKKIAHDENLKTWLQEAREYLYPLTMPRWIMVGLEEFKTESSIAYFTRKKEDYIESFDEHLKNTEVLLNKANEHLNKLEALFSENREFFSNTPSINDIHLYPTLRSLSVVKGLKLPERVLNYMKAQERLSKVPLHLNIAV